VLRDKKVVFVRFSCSYFIGISAGQLLWSFIRSLWQKKTVYWFVAYISFFGLCFVKDIDTLLFAFIQAIGSCAATVASVSMVRDLFPVRDIPKVFSLLMLVVGLSPMLAPTVGDTLQQLMAGIWFS
jgi:DHA1 family bicyclomycin/chloramphenicol resistance-like MFS transporter